MAPDRRRRLDRGRRVRRETVERAWKRNPTSCRITIGKQFVDAVAGWVAVPSGPRRVKPIDSGKLTRNVRRRLGRSTPGEAAHDALVAAIENDVVELLNARGSTPGTTNVRGRGHPDSPGSPGGSERTIEPLASSGMGFIDHGWPVVFVPRMRRFTAAETPEHRQAREPCGARYDCGDAHRLAACQTDRTTTTPRNSPVVPFKSRSPGVGPPTHDTLDGRFTVSCTPQ